MTIGWNNNLGPEGGKAIGEGLSALKQLSSLNLTIGYNNNLGPEGGKAIGEGLSALKQLSSLNLTIGVIII